MELLDIKIKDLKNIEPIQNQPEITVFKDTLKKK